MWSGHTVLFNSVFKVSLRHIQLVWLASISIAFMQWKTHWVKQPPALIKAFCPAFYSHHGNYAAAPKHPRQTTKEEADCPPPTHTPRSCITSRGWASSLCWTCCRASKWLMLIKTAAWKKCLSLCLRICVTDRFKNVRRIKTTRLQALVKCSN